MACYRSMAHSNFDKLFRQLPALLDAGKQRDYTMSQAAVSALGADWEQNVKCGYRDGRITPSPPPGRVGWGMGGGSMRRLDFMTVRESRSDSHLDEARKIIIGRSRESRTKHYIMQQL